MLSLTAWDTFEIISIICLGFSFFSSNIAIPDSLLMGVSISIIVIIITYFKDGAVNWTLIKHILVVFILIGGLLEIGIRIKRRRSLYNSD